MNSLSNNQHLKSEELREYKQGNLSNKEMHRLELHMIDCELCSDALEGLSKIDSITFAASVESIKSKTGAEQKFEINQKQWLAIAASFILLAVVSLVFYNWPSDADDVLALESKNEENLSLSMEESDAESLTPFDSITDEDTGKKDLIAEVVADPEAEKEEKRMSPAPIETVDNLDMAIAEDVPEIILEEETIDDSTMATLAATDEEPAQGLASRAKKAAVSPSESVSGQAEIAEDDVLIRAQPIKGQRAYDRYLKRKLQYPANAKENNIEGEVILQLIIDATGTIGNIVVTKSLGYGCDEEAIRLIKEGPAWDAGKRNGIEVEDTISLRVPFKL